MNLTSDQQKKGGAIAAFVLLAVGVLYYELHDPTPAPPPASTTPVVLNASPAATRALPPAPVPPGNVAGVNAKAIATTSGQLDPSLRMDAMLVTESLAYSGSGRNIFAANSFAPAAVTIRPIAPARPIVTLPPAPPQPTGPPPPPPIDLKFFGTATNAAGRRQGFLLHGEDVFLASPGDIVLRRYRVVAINANSIEIEDLPNSNKQTLPLQAN